MPTSYNQSAQYYYTLIDTLHIPTLTNCHLRTQTRSLKLNTNTIYICGSAGGGIHMPTQNKSEWHCGSKKKMLRLNSCRVSHTPPFLNNWTTMYSQTYLITCHIIIICGHFTYFSILKQVSYYVKLNLFMYTSSS